MKNEVENAILYIRDYVQAYNERSASAIARKLMDAVNVVIENYNTEEAKGVDLENEKLTRDMFMSLAFGEYIKWIDIEDAMCVPMQYYIKRISEHYLSEEDVNKRFYLAYMDHMSLERNIKYLQDETTYLAEFKERADELYSKCIDDDVRCNLRRMLADAELHIEELRESIRSLR